ncbi:MAG TPA: hypothetical protein VGH03_02090 [Caulobacteraceae bacterium]|jgi:fatty-acyl-CoA synthase
MTVIYVDADACPVKDEVYRVADRFGERVTAVLSPRPGREIDESELLTFVRLRISGYKIPRRLVVVDAVRRAANGKADYKWAREAALEAAGAG